MFAWETYLIVHLQGVPFSLGAEVLCVGVHREVDLLVEALDEDRVPVLVVQKAAQRDRHATPTAGSQPWVVWNAAATKGKLTIITT